MSDLNQEAKDYLSLYAQGDEERKPWVFAKALNQCQLDGSIESLERIEKLLLQIHQRFKPDEVFLARTDVKAFLRLLSYAIGQLIAAKSGQEIQWHSYESAAAISPPDQPLDKEPWSEVMGVIAQNACLPLGPLIEFLQKGKSAMTVRAYAERLIERCKTPPPMDENQRCQAYLRSFFTGELPHGGLIHADELVEIKLDYSLQSLHDLDRLLLKIRSSQPPDFQSVMSTPAYFNFFLWCSFYFGVCIARLARVQMKWLSYVEAKQHDPELDREFITHHCCVLDGRMYFPLAPFCVNLFNDPKHHVDIAAYAKQIIATMSKPMRQLSIPRELKTKEECETDVVLRAFYSAGNFAATCLFFDSVQGKDTAPRLLQPGLTSTEGSAIIDYSFFDSAQSGNETADNMMANNPERRPFLVHTLDSYANLATGRKDALTVRIKIFPTTRNPQGNAAFETYIMLPYCKPSPVQPYKTFSPIVQLCELTPGLKTEEALKAFMSGLVSYTVQDQFDAEPFRWTKFLDCVPLLS
jgi:hypothetical protein